MFLTLLIYALFIGLGTASVMRRTRIQCNRNSSYSV